MTQRKNNTKQLYEIRSNDFHLQAKKHFQQSLQKIEIWTFRELTLFCDDFFQIMNRGNRNERICRKNLISWCYPDFHDVAFYMKFS